MGDDLLSTKWLVVSHGKKKDGDLGWRGYHLGNGDVTDHLNEAPQWLDILRSFA